ncbi:MAG: AMP-binding protein, partial [Cyanobacteria bacterium P01_F01_bin.143]
MNMSSFIDYRSVNSLPEIWPIAAKEFGEKIALKAPHIKPAVSLSYQELNQKIQCFAAGLQALGITSGEKIALFADNSPRWFIADQGIIMAGAADVVRSGSAEQQELLYIYGNSDSSSLIVENLKTFNRLSPQITEFTPKFVILLSDEEIPANTNLKILNFSQLLDLGSNHSLETVEQNKSTLATLIYTSGTTGKPKGVMLSHGNLLHQVNSLRKIIPCDQGDRVLSILPSWHAYERSAEYFLLSQGCTQYYTNLRSLKSDLKKYQPHYMIGVPRLWESLYEGVQKQFREQATGKQKLINGLFNLSQQYIVARRLAQGLSLDNLQPSAIAKLSAILRTIVLFPLHILGDKIVYKKVREAVGGQVKSFVSGGGSLAKHLDDFYEVVNIPVLVGYGLTETSPVTNARTLERNFSKTAGQAIAETEIK